MANSCSLPAVPLLSSWLAALLAHAVDGISPTSKVRSIFFCVAFERRESSGKILGISASVAWGGCAGGGWNCMRNGIAKQLSREIFNKKSRGRQRGWMATSAEKSCGILVVRPLYASRQHVLKILPVTT